MKVLFYTNVPSPYRVDFFNELGKYCELTVLFEIGNSNERSDEWRKYSFKNFTGIVMKGVRVRTDMAFCPCILKYLKKGMYDRVIVTVLASPTAYLAVWALKLKKIPYVFEGDGGFAEKGKSIKAYFKRYIISNAKRCYSTSGTFDDYCKMYGAKASNILRYTFTSLREEQMLKECISGDEKRILREQLGIKEKKVILSVGRFVHVKGFDLLLKACENNSDEIGIYIIGGSDKGEYAQLQKQYNVKNVHYIEHMQFDTLKKYYQAADVFVFFSRGDVWGLVINEAMSQGLPVISTDKCGAALELVENGVNGYVVHSEAVEEMRDAINKMTVSEQICADMGKKSLEKIQKYTIEFMAKEHMDLLNEAW